ncbi:endospore germination permease [Paenibacillus sp. NEAU-GSW1]|uniref:endospore germination permease n=1 Tax=Paenibacillus sp. NEAU-GSW1 TaxID=2682486 RepID=UPI0012E1ABF8|nr:endospore germination permease [Paenibacillus sp. NEAU-GSW1]MUT64383.1 endospore germination permease [Paenibacillus sp. NEAU-GSW1]
MNYGDKQISIWLSFSILMLSAGLICHVLAIPAILDAAGRDSWIAIIAAMPFFLLFMYLMYVVIRRIHGQRLTDWIERQFGVVPAWILRLSASFLLLVLGTHTLFETSNWTVSTYLQFTPFPIIVFAGALVSALAALRGLPTIAMTSAVLLPLVLVLGYFVMGANTKYKNYNQLLPILEHGMDPVWRGLVYALAGMVEVWILVLYQHELKSKIKLWHLLLLGVFMVGITLGPTIGGITEFGPVEAAKQRVTPYDQWKLVNVGKLLQHVDFLSIYQWLSGSFARIAISIYLIVDLLNIRRPRKRLVAIAVITLVMGSVSMYFWRVELVYLYVNRIQFPAVLIYASALVAVLALLSWWRKEDKEVAK